MVGGSDYGSNWPTTLALIEVEGGDGDVLNPSGWYKLRD